MLVVSICFTLSFRDGGKRGFVMGRCGLGGGVVTVLDFFSEVGLLI